MILRPYLALLALASIVSSASGAIIMTGDFALGTGTLTITAPVSFTVTTAGSIRGIVFSGWAATDGSTTTAIPTVGTIQYTLNSGTPTTIALNNIVDHRPSNAGAITAGDTALTVGLLPVVVGDVFTLTPQVITFNSTTGFNSALLSTYTGTPFIASSTGASLSAAVPEPSTGLLGLLGAAAFLRRRR